jgi:hypothetical protein
VNDGETRSGRARDGKYTVGNPGGRGRPRGATLTSELRRQGDPTAIAGELLKIIHDPKTGVATRLKAIELYGDRVEGKAIGRSIQMRGSAASLLPGHFFSLPAQERLRELDALRARSLAEAIDVPAFDTEGNDDDQTP